MRQFFTDNVWIRFVAVVLIWTTAPIPALAEGPIAWKTYDEGMALAKATNKKVFLFFGAAWCGACDKMGAETFQNTEVLRFLNDEYISIKVDTDREYALASKYRIQWLPDIWFIDKTGKAIVNRIGYAPAGTLIKIFSHIQSTYDEPVPVD